jgi:cephalosporin hydroxylase
MSSVESDYQAVGREYFRRYYELGVWKRQHYRGVRILKLPTDLWNYQEIFTDQRIEWVVETGTLHGGSALLFADLLGLSGCPGRVITVDISHAALQVKAHPRIDFVLGSSASEETAARIAEMLPANRGALFLILDSDHAKAHVLRELELFVPLLRRGDYLVVEDGCVNGHPVRPEFGPGPLEAIEEFLQQHPGLFIADRERERKFGCTAAPSGYLIRA